MNDTLKVAQVVKSNVWPRTDYAKMVKDGAPAWKAAMLKAVYDKLAAAPVTRKAPTDEDLKDYIETLTQIREALGAELQVRSDRRIGAKMKKTLKTLLVWAVSNEARPFEVWLLRAVLAYFGVRLGIDAAHAHLF